MAFRRGRWSRWPRYVSVAERRLAAKSTIEEMHRQGRAYSPIAPTGRAIVETFWGIAWCKNLERYSDFSNRLPRGRSYVRSGAVLHLQIDAGRIEAVVIGTLPYTVNVEMAPVPPEKWRAICKDCTGAIDSLVELLQGRISTAVLERICREKSGLFPVPREIKFSCSCPDWASMCKHVAAVLYGVGVRLDTEPELLFQLRGVDPAGLVTGAAKGLTQVAATPSSVRIIAGEDLTELFGVEIGGARAAGSEPTTQDKRVARLQSRQREIAIRIEEVTKEIDHMYEEMARLLRIPSHR